ncbi:zf-HC2 domain-containing protein [Thermophagus xiamenensis]|uniref:Putative zinc-finger n=1 Tax=Thermophagus xiamenensis TaxID=385682 RepID=A0A1I2AM80_9BACT|nr:zf-HC2 domain-containing protein [Thermophagus xiamenensis]SFE44000.1 Putative zinc-finger [Thermophagus xiamenensis]
MKISCSVVQDLLPLYVERMTSEESNLLIEDHLTDCNKCRNILNSLKTNIIKSKPDAEASVPLKFIQKNIKNRQTKAVVFASLIVFLAMFVIFSYLTKPDYISYNDSGITISKIESQEVYANFSENVTSYSTIKYNTSDNLVVMEIKAWTSVWDKLLNKSTPSVLISTPDSKVDRVYYCDYSTKDDNMIVVYGIDPNTNGGITSLPRIVLGYYFMIALIASIIVGVVWFLLRKNHKAGNICKYLFFVPTSYLISHMLLTTSFISFSATRDFVMNLIASIAIYGISILGISLFKQYKLDRTK